MEMHWPKATVVRWIDGDTVVLNIDTGFHNSREQTIRLVVCNTPERGQPGYQDAKDAVNRWAPPGSIVSLTTYKDDNWDRYLGDVVADGLSIHWRLLDQKLAVPYKKS